MIAKLRGHERILVFAALVGLVQFTLLNLALIVLYLSRRNEHDYFIYYAAARVGVEDGWSRMYQPELQWAILDRDWPGTLHIVFLNPPLVAWIVLPFTYLPRSVDLFAFCALMAVALATAALLVAPPGKRSTLAFVCLGFGMLPAAAAIAYGQVIPLVILTIAASWRLQAADRPIWGGAILTLALVKPHLVLLVPLALLLSGRWRAVAAWAGAASAAVLVSVLLLGREGIAAYLDALRWGTIGAGSPNNALWSLSVLLQSAALAWAIRIAVVAAVGWVAYRHRRGSLAFVMAAGVVGSLIVSPYLHNMDFALYAPVVWLLWRSSDKPVVRVIAIVSWAAISWSLANPYVALWTQLGVLSALAVVPTGMVNSRDGARRVRLGSARADSRPRTGRSGRSVDPGPVASV